MATMNLAQALKVKNRLGRRIAQLAHDIAGQNSHVDGAEVVDVRPLVEERSRLVDQLVRLKAAIARANAPIQDGIYRLGEIKAEVAFWKAVNTRHGKAESYGDQPLVYVAQIRKGEVDETIARLERAMDDLQDEIDAFNHTTEITVDDS